MKKNFFSLIALSSIIIFSSCQKDKQPDANTNLNKVKTYTENITSPGGGTIAATFNVGYDGNNRITSLTQTNASGIKFLFTYTSDTKYSMDLYESGSISVHEDFFLNSNSLPDSTFQYNNTQDSTTEKYLYNSNGQLVTLKEYVYSKNYGSEIDNITSYTYDSNGNVVNTTDTNNQIETFEYYPDLVYTVPLTNPALNQGINSTKKMNLVKTHTVTSNGSLVGTDTYTYTFDSNNRISTITQTADDGTIATQTFTYY